MHPQIATGQGKRIDRTVAHQKQLPGKAVLKLGAEFAARTPAGPSLLPTNVADAVYLLCLPEAAWVNGHTLVVDGGFAISG